MVPTQRIKIPQGEVPTSEYPRVMGLMSIHNLDALQHYAGYTYCPSCRKEGQNEGTVVNSFEDNPLQARSCVQQVLWLPISDVRLTPLAWAPRLSTVQCPFWVRSIQLIHLPNQGFVQGSKGGAI